MPKLSQIILMCLLAAVGWLSLPAPTSARELVFSDDFQSGLDNWQLVRGSYQHWLVTPSGLEAYLPNRFTISELALRDDYWQADWQNLEYEITFTPLQGVDKNLVFNFADISNWYEYHFTGNILHLVRLVGTSTPLSIFETYYLENNRTYLMKIRSVAGQLSLYINGQLISEAQDPTYLPGSFGKPSLKATTGAAAPTRVRFEEIKVYLVDEQVVPPEEPPLEPPDQEALVLPINHFKQTDPRWADQEYDHSQLWAATPTLERWGCLVSSVAMVLNYHGLTHLPGGVELDPSSLNHWLRTQPDGYVGQGLLNWLAISRLSNLVAAEFDTPKLEFSIVSDDLIEAAREAILNLEPIILAIPGHFLVAHGLVDPAVQPADPNQLIISDPFYDYQRLSDHSEPSIGGRRLRPSQTDLSYFLIVHSNEVVPELRLESQSGPELELITLNTPIIDPSDPSQAQPANQVMSLLPKPASGSYWLGFRRANQTNPLDTTGVEVYLYDQEAEVTILSSTLWRDQHWFKLTFAKESGGEWQLLATQSDWPETLEALWQNGQIPYYLYHGLTRLLPNLESANPINQQRTQALIKAIIDYYQVDHLPPLAATILDELAQSQISHQ